MKLETWRFAGPADASTVFSLPKTNFAFRLLSLSTRLEWGSAPTNILPVLDVLDGDNLPVVSWASDVNPIGATGDRLLATFSPAMIVLFGAIGITTSVGGYFRLPISIMPELWITPQMSVEVTLAGAQGPGSGGDNWLDTVLTVARL